MEKQELFCHACGKYVQFDVPETDGNLIVVCPNCKHEHCRVVKDGVITEDRWDSRNGAGNGAVMYATGTSSASTSFITSYTVTASSATVGISFIAQSWLNTGTTAS
jgi:uncharacterized protein YbaR (Trm112 family)